MMTRFSHLLAWRAHNGRLLIMELNSGPDNGEHDDQAEHDDEDLALVVGEEHSKSISWAMESMSGCRVESSSQSYHVIPLPAEWAFRLLWLCRASLWPRPACSIHVGR